MAERFNLVRLAELRDAHRAKVDAYRRSGEIVKEAAQAATRARLDAPPLPGQPPTATRYAFAPGIGQAAKPATVRAKTNDFYLLPVHALRAFTQDQLAAAEVDPRALTRILAAEARLERLRAEHGNNVSAVGDSAKFMKGIERFSREKRL